MTERKTGQLTADRAYMDGMYSSWSQGNALYARWAAEHGISNQTLLVLYVLDLKGRLTQAEAADYYGVPKQSINNAVRALREAGYLEFSASERDRREKPMELTAAGREYAARLLAPLYRLERRTLAILGEERVCQMLETMELFNLVFEREMGHESE